MRWLLRMAAGIVIAAISILGTLVWTMSSPHAKPTVPLTAGFSGGGWADVNMEFARRVAARFPLGSSEADMAMELRREGFSREDWGSSVDDEREAMRREDNWVCNVAAYVYWRADTDRRLTGIRGIYREEGCL